MDEEYRTKFLQTQQDAGIPVSLWTDEVNEDQSIGLINGAKNAVGPARELFGPIFKNTLYVSTYSYVFVGNKTWLETKLDDVRMYHI